MANFLENMYNDNETFYQVFNHIAIYICILYGKRYVGFLFFWSLDQLVVETLGVAFVRSSVRPFVRHAFSRKPLITFFMKLYS